MYAAQRNRNGVQMPNKKQYNNNRVPIVRGERAEKPRALRGGSGNVEPSSRARSQIMTGVSAMAGQRGTVVLSWKGRSCERMKEACEAEDDMRREAKPWAEPESRAAAINEYVRDLGEAGGKHA